MVAFTLQTDLSSCYRDCLSKPTIFTIWPIRKTLLTHIIEPCFFFFGSKNAHSFQLNKIISKPGQETVSEDFPFC